MEELLLIGFQSKFLSSMTWVMTIQAQMAVQVAIVVIGHFGTGELSLSRESALEQEIVPIL